MSRVLITGASGFTGKYLRRSLESTGYEVIGLGAGDSEDIQCGIEDVERLRRHVSNLRPEFVVHLAAISSPAHPDTMRFYAVNVIGTENLMTALADMDSAPEKIIVASSANVYGSAAARVTDESMCPRPVNHYACSKLAMEHMVSTWFDRLPVLITRPFNYTGVGQDDRFLIPKIVYHYAARKREISLGNTKVSRDFSDVREVVDTYRRLLAVSAHAEVVNVCSGVAVSISEILEMMERIAGYRLEVQQDPDLRRRSEVAELRGSTDKLARMVGSVPQRPLVDTLEWMFGHASDSMA